MQRSLKLPLELRTALDVDLVQWSSNLTFGRIAPRYDLHMRLMESDRLAD